jgi:hypothetical protein
MTGAIFGSFAGLAIAVAIAMLVPVGFFPGVLLGFGLSMTGLLIGSKADR